MKRILIFISSGIIILLLAGYLILRAWIGESVKENIDIAMASYPGTPEDALIDMLLDESIPMVDRTHKAVWTLGHIKSEKALPILNSLYRDDPRGSTCYGKHESMLCQYEIHKAMVAIEKVRLMSYKSLKMNPPLRNKILRMNFTL